MSRRLDFSKLKFSDKIISTEEALKDVESFNLEDIRGCIVKESIQESFKQIGEYKQGKRQFKSLKESQELWEKWVKESEEKIDNE